MGVLSYWGASPSI